MLLCKHNDINNINLFKKKNSVIEKEREVVLKSSHSGIQKIETAPSLDSSCILLKVQLYTELSV